MPSRAVHRPEVLVLYRYTINADRRFGNRPATAPFVASNFLRTICRWKWFEKEKSSTKEPAQRADRPSPLLQLPLRQPASSYQRLRRPDSDAIPPISCHVSFSACVREDVVKSKALPARKARGRHLLHLQVVLRLLWGVDVWREAASRTLRSTTINYQCYCKRKQEDARKTVVNDWLESLWWSIRPCNIQDDAIWNHHRQVMELQNKENTNIPLC